MLFREGTQEQCVASLLAGTLSQQRQVKVEGTQERGSAPEGKEKEVRIVLGSGLQSLLGQCVGDIVPHTDSCFACDETGVEGGD